jgi:hypothetical protein
VDGEASDASDRSAHDHEIGTHLQQAQSKASISWRVKPGLASEADENLVSFYRAQQTAKLQPEIKYTAPQLDVNGRLDRDIMRHI